MNYKLSASEIRELIVAKLSHNFGVTPAEATDEHYYKAVVLILRDLMTEGRKEFIDQAEKENPSRSIISAWNFSWAVPCGTTFTIWVWRTRFPRL